MSYKTEYQTPEILKTNEQRNNKLNVHDLIKCLTAPLTEVNLRWLNLCTQSLNNVRKLVHYAEFSYIIKNA